MSIKMTLPRRVSEYRCKFVGQFMPQPAYIELDPEEGTLCADYSGVIGNAVPAAVYYGRLFRFKFPPSAKLKDVRRVMKSILPLCEKLCEGYDTEWNGSNMVGRYDYDLYDRIEAFVYYELR